MVLSAIGAYRVIVCCKYLYIYTHIYIYMYINMHAFMHTLLSLVVVGISIQGLGTGNWTPRRRRRSCWTRPGALGKAASCSRDHVSKLDICLTSLYNGCQCEYTYTIIPMWDYVLLHCIMFCYSIVWKSTIDSFLDMVMISMGNGICHVCAPAIIFPLGQEDHRAVCHQLAVQLSEKYDYHLCWPHQRYEHIIECILVLKIIKPNY